MGVLIWHWLHQSMNNESLVITIIQEITVNYILIQIIHQHLRKILRFHSDCISYLYVSLLYILFDILKPFLVMTLFLHLLTCLFFIFILKVIVQLVRSLDSIKVPAARAIIIWIIGEYNTIGEIIPRMLTTVLTYLAWCFASEAQETKLQILNTAVKVLSAC